MRDDSAENCSNSAISAQTKIKCECDIHTKPPTYGNFLTPDYVPEFKRNNLPCKCQCDKCIGTNRHILNDKKVDRIKKRIFKAYRKIADQESVVAELGYNSSKNSVSMTNGHSDHVKNSLSYINNLCGLKVLIQASGMLVSKKK